MEGSSGNVGIRIVPVERRGCGQRRGQGGVERRSKCGERFGWMARVQVHARQAVQARRLHVRRHRGDNGGKRRRAAYDKNFCKDCYYLRQAERQEPEVCGKRWRIMVGEKSYRGKLSACLGAKGFENKMSKTKSLLSEAATALQLGKSWPEESPYREELALLRASDGLHLVRRATGWRRKRLVGASEEQRPQCVDEGEDTGVLPRKEAGGRSAKEHLRSRFCRRARTCWGGSLRQLKGREGVTLSCVCPHCHRFPRDHYIQWVSAQSSGRDKERP